MAKANDAGAMKPKKSGSGSKQTKNAAQKKPSIFARLAQYFRDVKSEMKRVVWPTRHEVLNSSLVVVVTLIFFVFFTLIVDTLVVQALELWSKLG
jgi:preprotein translocase subunit SecE